MEHQAHHAKKNTFGIFLATIVVINVLLTLFVIFRKDAALKIEEMKVGGADNMALVQKLYESDSYKAQQKAAIEQIVGQMKAAGDTAPTAGDTAPTADTTAPTAQAVDNASVLAVVENVKKSGYFRGDKDARIMILEYSELLCPFCKRQEDGKVIAQVLEKYGNKVTSAFRHFIVHAPAKKLAEAAECVGKAKGMKAFYSYLEGAFANQGSVDDAKSLSLAKDAGAGDISACVNNGDFSAAVDAQQQEGRTFGVSGTPGNVIIDTKTGKFVLVAGAYPVEKFVEEIDKLLAE